MDSLDGTFMSNLKDIAPIVPYLPFSRVIELSVEDHLDGLNCVRMGCHAVVISAMLF